MTGDEFHTIKILLVEDEPFMCATLKWMLRGLGRPDVSQAADGLAAFAILRSGYRPDLIMCDVQMEPMDGLTFMRHLRGMSELELAETPAIMLTATSDGQTVREALDLGNTDYLLKPVSPKLLAEHIEASLARKAMRSARAAQ